MPIRINLLAEAQAEEELRRKDPVKRALLAGVLLVVLAVFWGTSQRFKIMTSKSELRGLEAKWKSLEKGYQVAVENKRESIEVEGRLSALQQLKTNKFLWGTALNAFQQTLSGIEDVQVVRLKTDQVYTLNEEAKGRAVDNKNVGGKPATATEKVTIVIDALDASAQPGSQVSKFKEAISSVPYFQANLQKTNSVLLTSLSAPQSGSLVHNPYVMFTLQCYFPEKVR